MVQLSRTIVNIWNLDNKFGFQMVGTIWMPENLSNFQMVPTTVTVRTLDLSGIQMATLYPKEELSGFQLAMIILFPVPFSNGPLAKSILFKK
jgi:hypothetical protein